MAADLNPLKEVLPKALALLLFAPWALLAQTPPAPDKAASTVAPANVDGFDPYKRQVELERLKSQKRDSASSVGPVADQFCTLHIKEGKLLLEGLEKCVDVKKLFGPGDVHSVPATLQNIVTALREMDGGANITLSPGLETLVIQDLKFRFDRPNPGLFEGLRVASGEKFRANLTSRTYERTPDGGNTTREWNISLIATENPAAAKIVETFNISGFIEYGVTMRKPTEQCLKEFEEILEVTLREFSEERSEKALIPRLKFHAGAGLLVVIGTPESVDVCRKVVFALPGMRAPIITPPPGGKSNPF